MTKKEGALDKEQRQAALARLAIVFPAGEKREILGEEKNQ